MRYNNQWLTFATTASPSGWGLVQFSFDDWSQAAAAPHTYLDTSPMGSGYRAAPQVFYSAPQDLWYMVYQTGPPTYSTSTNPADPRSWSAPRLLMSEEPQIVKDNKGDGTWIDFWVICDTTDFHLFFRDDNGHIYRARTSLGNFVYKVAGSGQYLLLQEAISNPSGRRYFRSFTSTSLTGGWSPLAATEEEPFASRKNVSFPGGVWTEDISHGEMVRAGNDQTLTIDPCRMQYVYQGIDPRAETDYMAALAHGPAHPNRLHLLTARSSIIHRAGGHTRPSG